jgi:hypothetical protein
MKKVLITIVALFLFVGISQAQNKMWLNIGGNVYLPMGDFADVAGTGFGGTAQFEMQFMPQLLGTGSIGYLTWGGKDIQLLGGNYSYSSSAIPVLVGAKYYFMPSGGFYGQAQLGLFFFSTTVDVPSYNIGGVTYGGGETSDSDSEFAFSFGAGYELPLSPKLTLDLSGAFLVISDANNIGIRAGIKFAL